jgi:hypothetical protein
MATTTKPRRGTAAGKGKTSKASTSKATRKATENKGADDGPSKRELQREQNDALREQVVEMREAEASWADIADELSITSGKAQFLHMQHVVSETPKLKIRYKDEDELVEGIRDAREAEDQYSSWGWIAARTGVSEAKVKRLAEEAGISMHNVAVSRAEAKAGDEDDEKPKRSAGKGKTTSGAAKTAAAKKRAAGRAGKRPS